MTLLLLVAEDDLGDAIALGLREIAPPDGAFYVYASVAHLTDDSLAFCQQLLRDTGAFELVEVRRAEYPTEDGTATGSPAVVEL